MAPIKEWFGAYNVIFSWFEKKYGYEALEDYWKFIAENCFSDVVKEFEAKGLCGIKEYYERTFKIDNGECLSKMENGSLEIKVVRCPDYDFMNSSDNPYCKAIKSYCRHHEVINSVLAEKSGCSFTMPECDNNGACRWVFERKKAFDACKCGEGISK